MVSVAEGAMSAVIYVLLFLCSCFRTVRFSKTRRFRIPRQKKADS